MGVPHLTQQLRTSSGFVEVDIDALQLKIRISVVCTGWVNTMLIADHLKYSLA